ncbi:MAG: hypothetical protein GY906_14740, partial [bacterium]|nr:hypothetical protein [bacterium]
VYIVPVDTPEKLDKPIGTGPYRLVDHEPGDRLRMAAFKRYWGQQPAESQVEILFREDPKERVKLLVDGAADLIEDIPPEQIEATENTNGLWVESRIGNFVFYLALDRSRPPLDNAQVREAVDLAVDRQALADGVFRGHAQPANQISGPTTFGHSTAVLQPRHDLTRVGQLLKQVGFDEGPQLTLHYSETRVHLAEAILSQLNAAGFRATGERHSWPELLALLERKEADLVLIGENNSPMDGGYFFDSIIHSTSPEQGLGDFNFINFSDPEIDRLIEAAARQMNPSKRRLELETVSRRLAEQRVVLPLVWVVDLFGVRRELQWTPRSDSNFWAAEMSRSR